MVIAFPETMFAIFASSVLLLAMAACSAALDARSTASKDFDPAKHLGNLAPYLDAPPSGLSKALPEGCTVDQVSLMQRHGSRQPIVSELVYIQNVSDLLGNNSRYLKHVPAEFEFLKTWTNTLTNDSLSPLGRLELFSQGVKFNLSYPHLSTSLIVAGAQDRVIESAQWFREGYYGRDFDKRSNLETIPEDNLTFSRITPMNNCSAWKYAYGQAAVDDWGAVYLPRIAKRFNKVLPGFNFTNDNIHGMLYACAYELVTYGSTPWCGIFEQTEILDFEYELDLLMEYAFGYGLPGILGPTLGSVYVNTLIERLTNSSGNSSEMYIDVGHDTTIDLTLTGLGLIKDTHIIPRTGPAKPSRAWKTTNQVPFAAKMITERFSCFNQTYVRIILNDAPLPLTFCKHMQRSTGACTLEDFNLGASIQVTSNVASANVTRDVYNRVCNNTVTE